MFQRNHRVPHFVFSRKSSLLRTTMMSSQLILLHAFLLLGISPHFVNGSSTLVLKEGSAVCTDSWQLNKFQVVCPSGSCTYGSMVYISGQMEAFADIPSSAHVTVKAFGMYKMYDEVLDICSSGVLTPPEGDDSGYFCPEAGVYNYASHFQLPTVRSSYSDWYGFNVPLKVTIQDADDDNETVAHCSLKISVEEGTDGYSTDYVAAGAVFGIAGLASLLFLKRRRIGIIQLAEEESTMTHFEMITDQYTARV